MEPRESDRDRAERWRIAAEQYHAELERTRGERDLAAQDADRRSCQGGWRLAQERAVKVIQLQAEVERLRAVLLKIASDEFGQAAGLVARGAFTAGAYESPYGGQSDA